MISYGRTDGRTDGRTLLDVKSLSRLKNHSHYKDEDNLQLFTILLARIRYFWYK